MRYQYILPYLSPFVNSFHMVKLHKFKDIGAQKTDQLRLI